jgi:recombination protein RecT
MAEQSMQKVDARVPQVRSLLERAAPSFAQVLPKHLSPDRLVRIVVASVARTPALLDCDQMSLLQAVMQAAELGLEPGSALGEAYLVPFKGKVTMIPGYRGLISLARRSGQIEDIEAHVVYARDKFVHRKGTSACLDHEPSIEADRGEIVAVYALGWVKGSTRPHVEVMTKADIDKVRQGSQGRNMGPWTEHFGEMARKTVVRRLVKYLPMSVELANALDLEDETFSVGASHSADVISLPTSGTKKLADKVTKAAEKTRAAGPELDADGQATAAA